MAICKQSSLTPFIGNLTPVRALSTANINGNYYNGPVGNGVDATLTVNGTSLTVDHVVLKENDRILITGQIDASQNGIYVVSCIHEDLSKIILQRSEDQQSIAQMRAGQFTFVTEGEQFIGSVLSLVEPLPANLGIDPIKWKVISNS